MKIGKKNHVCDLVEVDRWELVFSLAENDSNRHRLKWKKALRSVVRLRIGLTAINNGMESMLAFL